MASATPHPHVAEVNDRAFRAGIKIQDLLREAGVAPSTWLRWTRGGDHRAANIDHLHATLSKMIEERGPDAQAEGDQPAI